jgi:transcriptional regulator with XRE-family HTH domain
MDTYSQVAWERLGAALKERRVALGYGYRKRGDFARDTGMGAKTLQRLENGERSFYPAETVAQAEAAYQVEPGSFAACLRGGHLRPLVREADGLVPRDEFEIAAVAKTDKPWPERLAAIHRHRELLAELGITELPEIPEALRRAVRRYGAVTEPGAGEQRRGA